MAQYSFQISITDANATVNVETAGLPAPRSTPVTLYSQTIRRQSGLNLGVGWQSCTWTWDYLTAAQLAILRTYCTGSSQACWIRTLKEDTTTYAYYSAILNFPPPPYNQRAGRTLNLTVEFVNLVAYTPA